MQIRNAVIITEDDSPIRMTIEELDDFSGNVVFCRSQLSSDIAEVIDELRGRSGKVDASTANFRGMPMKPELIS